MQQNKIQTLKNKSEIKVVFILFILENWKYESIYKKIDSDRKFSPTVVICPFNAYDDSKTLLEMSKCEKYCNSRGYNYLNTWDELKGEWLDFKNILMPDIVFFPLPHALTRKEYLIDNFLDTLTCYIPYSIRTDHLTQLQFNQPFHQLVWKNMYETSIHKSIAEKYSLNKGRNIEVVGYPTLEQMVEPVMQISRKAKKIIWAPHWTIIKSELNRSCFLVFYKYFITLAKKYESEIEVVFRPHPLLRKALYSIEDWGESRTDEYYSIWETTSNLSISTGGYIELFNSSDMIVHDSVSFLSEYLVTKKPAIFTKRENDLDPPFNEFGNICLDAHYVVYNEDQLDCVIDEVLFHNKDSKKDERADIVDNYLVIDQNCSDKVLGVLRESLR